MTVAETSKTECNFNKCRGYEFEECSDGGGEVTIGLLAAALYKTANMKGQMASKFVSQPVI